MSTSIAIAVTLLQSAPEGAVQKSIEPPSGGISPLAWVIICALAAAIAALGKFCLTLYNDLKEARKELAESYEDQATLLKALRVGLDMPKNPGDTAQGGRP